MSLDILLTKNPIIHRLGSKSVADYRSEYVETATHLNIATGFISNESIIQLKNLVEYRNHQLHLSLLIGMNYMDGFTQLQYDAVKELGEHLEKEGLGNVYVSTNALYHGKMYSFMQDSKCLGSFVGSSNLGSFIGTTHNYIETDLFFSDELGREINDKIVQLTNILGSPVNKTKAPANFKVEQMNLLDGYSGVTKLTGQETEAHFAQASTESVIIPLKDCPKSHLNTYFGAGKIKNRFSTRDYYEVELIISKKTKNLNLLPLKKESDITVVTCDGYKFKCSRQGDCGKNFRSVGDLRILGKWIKGHMENRGALKLGEPVTEETLKKFGMESLVLTASNDRSFWLLEFK